jgi:hypothetical protein
MRNSAHAPYDNQIYKIAKIDRDTTIQGKGSACGAGGCTLTFNFGQSRSFTYNAGININTPIGGTVGFSYGSGQSASVLFGFSWLHGEEPGMNLNFTSNYPKWDLRTISALQQRLRAYTREIAEVEEQKEIMDLTRFCSQGQTVQAKNYHFPGSVFTYTVGPYSYLWSPNGPDTYAGAKLSFDDDNDDYGNGITATLGTVAIICGQGLQITTNPAVWRSGIDSDNLQWENYLTYNIID